MAQEVPLVAGHWRGMRGMRCHFTSKQAEQMSKQVMTGAMQTVCANLTSIAMTWSCLQLCMSVIESVSHLGGRHVPAHD